MPVIPILTAASGLDIRLRNSEGNLTDPASITYDITEPGGTLVADDVAPFKRSVGHYDARTTIIPSGFSTSEAWKIDWTWTSPGGVTSTKCEEFSVGDSLDGFFDDVTEVKVQIKTDLAVTATELTDDQLDVFIQKSIDRLNFKLRLQGTSGELSYDTNTGQISPTPNSTIRAFVVMQAECLIAKRRQAQAASKGIRVRDGRSEIDTTAGARGHDQAVKNVCDVLAECIERYLEDQALGITGDEGAANNGDLIWAGNSRICEDADYDGQAFSQRDFRSQFADSLGHYCNHRCD